jgi:hypothetical protein
MAPESQTHLGPCLCDDDLDILYNRCQHLLYMAVPEHVNPMVFVQISSNVFNPRGYLWS